MVQGSSSWQSARCPNPKLLVSPKKKTSELCELFFPVQSALGFVVVGLLWGFTNPFIKRGSEGIKTLKVEDDARFPRWFYEVVYLATRWQVPAMNSSLFLIELTLSCPQFLLPFLLNMSGSVVYYLTLSTAGRSVCGTKHGCWACCYSQRFRWRPQSRTQ